MEHKAPDYSPDVVDPAGPSNVPADPAYADPETGRASSTATGTAAPASAAGGSSATLEPTDTTPRDETVLSDRLSMRDRLEGEAPEESDGDPDETGGKHRT